MPSYDYNTIHHNLAPPQLYFPDTLVHMGPVTTFMSGACRGPTNVTLGHCTHRQSLPSKYSQASECGNRQCTDQHRGRLLQEIHPMQRRMPSFITDAVGIRRRSRLSPTLRLTEAIFSHNTARLIQATSMARCSEPDCTRAKASRKAANPSVPSTGTGVSSKTAFTKACNSAFSGSYRFKG